jgi:hypothetical protein
MGLLSVVLVKIFLHQPSQSHRIWLVLQVFPFVIFRLGNMWHSMKPEDKEKYEKMARHEEAEHRKKYPGR